MRKLRYVFAAAVSGALLFFATPALAQPLYTGTTSSDQACATLRSLNPDNVGCNAAEGGVNKVIRLALHLLSIVAGAIAVIMIIVSGFKYITAQGDPNQISSAKSALIYAIVGLVVVVFAQMIVEFVLRRAT
jgi:hypothetical protein